MEDKKDLLKTTIKSGLVKTLKNLKYSTMGKNSAMKRNEPMPKTAFLHFVESRKLFGSGIDELARIWQNMAADGKRTFHEKAFRESVEYIKNTNRVT